MNFYLTLALFFICVLFTIFIFNRICEKFAESDPMLKRLREKLRPAFPDINHVILLKGTKSYTINKKKIHLCLVDEFGNYYDENMLVFVLLHELAHVRCDEIGHTEKFHHIFQNLLEIATKHNIYNPNAPIIKNYCEYKST